MTTQLEVTRDCMRGVQENPRMTVLSWSTRLADGSTRGSRLLAQGVDGRRYLITVEEVPADATGDEQQPPAGRPTEPPPFPGD